MTEPLANSTSVNGTADLSKLSENGTITSSEATTKKYQDERQKRLRNDGNAQYLNPAHHANLVRFQQDPWATSTTPNPGLEKTKNGDRFKVVIVGAGFGGLQVAVRLLQAGITNFVLVDTASGFGGTWYWNRYPGLMCDVESYIYMPLLEEMDYVPKHKYSSGNELRQYAEKIANKFALYDKALFRCGVNEMHWVEAESEWSIKLNKVGGGKLNIRGEFVIVTTGLINTPKLPDIPGLDSFMGHSFHTSRWDYELTGGNSDDPHLAKMKNKRVGVVGTGATAIQLVPALVEAVGELFVFQRTPSAVDVRNNKLTDPVWFEQVVKKSGPGWQRRRAENFNHFLENDANALEDLVNDAWTKMPSFSAVLGSRNRPVDMAEHIAQIHALDLPRQNRVRGRVDEVVNDKGTAEKLQPWYPGWCKRPCFHDGYLAAFNRPNVTLIDTDGKGIERVTANGPVVKGIEYPLDMLIFSTGYIIATGDSPAGRSGFKAYGRNGKLMDDKWKEGVSTLHGIITGEFPNFFFPGPNQAAGSANIVYTLDIMSEHIVYIISEAEKRSYTGKMVIEPENAAMEKWTSEIVARAGAFAPLGGCTPSYFNAEGATDKPKSTKEIMKAARGAPWGGGGAEYVDILEKWRREGSLSGLMLSTREPPKPRK